jgi:16S rRNA (uracil1498-N3)-methyltransferase
VHHIIPVTTERGGVRLDAARAAKRHAHWQGVVIAACEQSGRTRLPAIDAPRSLQETVAQLQGLCLVLDPTATLPLTAAPVERGAGVTLLIGPEGGFSDTEVAMITDAGGLGVRLGPRVLRTETAGVAALAALQAAFGDLSV